MIKVIPVNEPLLDIQDLDFLKEAFNSGWISSAGKYIEQFENDWATYCGMDHGISVSNGTAALQIAVEAVGVGEGDEVIMPDFTIISCGQAITNLGAKPVPIDSCKHTWCMDASKIEACISKRTKAIMVVHMYGHCVDMDVVLNISKKYNLTVIEDAAEVHGAKYLSKRNTKDSKWLTCGGIGHISTFSFFANKLITTGEGGMILTSNAEFAKKSRELRNLCFMPERRFKHENIGYNFRLTNLQAAIGVSQIKRIEEIVKKKREIGKYYQDKLKKFDGVILQEQKSWSRSVFWVNGLLLDKSIRCSAEKFCEELKSLGVETRPFFYGMHSQPVYKHRYDFDETKYTISRNLTERGFYLPSGLTLKKSDVDTIIEKFELVWEKYYAL